MGCVSSTAAASESHQSRSSTPRKQVPQQGRTQTAARSTVRDTRAVGPARRVLNVLRVRTSPRDEGHGSLSRKLGNAFFERLEKKAATHNVKVVTVVRDLAASPLPHLNQEFAEKGFAFAGAMPVSSELSNEIKAADVVVIESPVHNFFVPASLKLWYDLALTAGVAFEYREDGPHGLLGDKKFVLLQSSGATPVDAPINYATQHFDFLIGKIAGGQILAKLGALAQGGDESFDATVDAFDDSVFVKLFA
ncbi:MAG: hypothetical protein MHM6MM_004160 [Cercozoa sp. M6MM]